MGKKFRQEGIYYLPENLYIMSNFFVFNEERMAYGMH
jgi:hypothetical protein